jgi:hypothetical protein
VKIESVRALKDELAAEVIAAAGDAPDVVSFYAATEPPTPAGVALGVSRRADGEHVLAIRSAFPAAAEAIAARAAGEADVRIVTVSKRSNAKYFQATRRPLEPGAQVGMADRPFVGTLGCFVRDAAGVLYALSNSHVLADEGRAAPGHRIGQPYPTSPVGLLARFVSFSAVAPNLVDAAIMRLDKTTALLGYTQAIPGPIRGIKDVGPEMLGAEVRKVGRTTGSRVGRITTVEMDGLPVAYDQGVVRFNDQVEISGGPATDFSAPGDSGSLIVTSDGYAVALLFAGGRDGAGEDFTYANPIIAVLGALGVTLA